MKQILVMGAGQSATYLIDYLLKEAEKKNWFVTVGDLNRDVAAAAVNNHSCGSAIAFDINDAAMRETQIKKADIVVNLLHPMFQHLIAIDCLHYGKHLVTASYEDPNVKLLDQDAHRKGILILNEMGLDPGIDHMSAMKLIHSVQSQGGIVSSFLSYGGALPAPDSAPEPLRYAITWNPRNVIRAGEAGALYKEGGKLKTLSHHNVFKRTWPVDVNGMGTFEAYPNRNSMMYQELFGLKNVETMVRGTLRYPGWSETWQQIVTLGLPNDTMPIPELAEMTYREYTQMFLPLHVSGSRLENRVANFLGINPTGRIMDNLAWLGLFSDEKIGGNHRTSAEVMTALLNRKLPLPPGGRDMVILIHEIDVQYPDQDNRRERIVTTLVDYGVPDGFTAISKTVGLPAAIAAKMILEDQLPLTGCHIPTHPAIYEPVLAQLKDFGLAFEEVTTELE